MAPMTDVYVEIGSKRVFAGSVEWPGWCRSGRDEGSALASLAAYGGRYRASIGRSVQGFAPPTSAADHRVVERLRGNATTDFGVPPIAPGIDDRSPVPHE